jgi:putative ABC transport system permease protein
VSRLTSAFRFLFRRERVEHELESELRYHIDRQVELNMARGMNREEAMRQAAILVGGIEPTKDDCRDARLGRMIETLIQDVRYALRVLVKNPGFTLSAALTLALGIGANSAIFSLVYGVLLRPLPYMHGEQLVVLHQDAFRANQLDVPFSVKEIADYRDHSHTLQGVVEHHSMNFLLIGKDVAERVETAVVSANFFEVLGVKPILGRAFVGTDEAHGAPAVLILSHRYWLTHQGGDPNIVGKVFQMNNRPHTVIGVLPPIPQFPAESDVYMPTSQCPYRSSAGFIANRQARMMTAFARLKPGVTLQQAQADLSVIASNIEATYPDAYPKSDGYRIGIAALQDDLTRRARTMFLVLMGVTGFVLLTACANVANLLLARLMKLERELAIRSALGASRFRLVRQLLTESVLLSLFGGLLGLALAPAALALLTRFAERFTTRAPEVRIDAPVLLFALLVSIAMGILFGLAPAITTSGSLSEAFQQASARSTSSRSRQYLRFGLVIAQVAVSVVLLVGAGLMIRSFGRLQQVTPGFTPDRVLTVRVSPGFPPYTGETAHLLLEKILARIKTLNGVESCAMSSSYPFNPVGLVNGPQSNAYKVEGRPTPPGQTVPKTDIRVVTAGYFATIRQPIVKGRNFTPHDTDTRAPAVIIINQTMARLVFPNEDPIGKRLQVDGGMGQTASAEIVGIAGDVKEYGLAQPTIDEVYGALRDGFVNRLVVRTAVDAQMMIPLVRSALHDIDPLVAIDKVETIEHAEYESLASPRMMTFLLGIFAALAVAISGSGIAAVMALAVSQRTREIGVRMALGAQRGLLVTMLVRQGLLLALAGTVIGIAGSVTLTKLLQSLLYRTSPNDLITLAGVCTCFLLVAMIASFIPARQVTAIDPVSALRQD